MGNKVGKKEKKSKIEGEKALLYSYQSSIEDLDTTFQTFIPEVPEKDPKDEVNEDSESYQKTPNTNVIENTVITPVNTQEESQMSEPSQENPVKSCDTNIGHDKSVQTDSDWLDAYVKEHMGTQDSKNPKGNKKHGLLFKQDKYDEVGEDDIDEGDRRPSINEKSRKPSLRKYFTERGRFQTVRVSIPDSDDDDYAYHPITSLPARKVETMKPQKTLSHDQSSSLPQEVELRAENILNKTLEDNFVKFMMNKSVTAADLGYREKRGNLTKLRCIKVWLNKKRDEEDVRDKEYVPKMIDGSPVDKVEGNGHLLAAEEAWLLFCRKKRAIGIVKHEAKEHIDLPFLVRSNQVNKTFTCTCKMSCTCIYMIRR